MLWRAKKMLDLVMLVSSPHFFWLLTCQSANPRQDAEHVNNVNNTADYLYVRQPI